MVQRAGLSRSDARNVLTVEELVAERYDALLRVALLICRDREDAKDAVQIALERAWKHEYALRDPDRLAAWLHRIAVREAIRLERHRRGLFSRWLSPPREIPVASPSDDDGDLDLRDALQDLTVEQRAVLVLHYYAGYSVAETAEVAGIPLETARSRLRVARGRLRTVLGGNDEQP